MFVPIHLTSTWEHNNTHRIIGRMKFSDNNAIRVRARLLSGDPFDPHNAFPIHISGGCAERAGVQWQKRATEMADGHRDVLSK